MRVLIMIAAVVILGGAPFALVARQQGKGTQQPSGGAGAKNGASKDAGGDTSTGGKAANSAGNSAATSAEPNYDPFHAAQDVEVGKFYMDKGDPDAAIDRFKDAVKLRPDWAEPRKLLGECYEKKHDKASALKYYKEYLKVFPNPTDRKKIQKKIEKLSKG